MTLHIPPFANSSPHLPFGDQQNAPFYGKDILSVKQFTRADLEYIFGVAHEMQRDGAPRRHLRPAQRQDPGQPVLRALHPHLVLLHLGHGAPGRQRDPDQRSALLLGLQGRIPARYRPHPGMLRRCDRAAPPGDRRRPRWPPSTPASRSSTPATASASTPPRRCSTCSPSRRSWARSTA